jgi:uncharacterized protein
MTIDKDKKVGLKQLLDNEYIWPSKYIFKFVVRADKLKELKEIVGEEGLSEKESSKGKYISLTIVRNMSSSEEVINFYEKVYVIEGIIAL